MSIQHTPIEVLYLFADEDALLLKQLEHHLSVLQNKGTIITWHKRKIVAGSDWEMELDQHLNTASLILLLISPAFLASDYCYGIEMTRAMQRYEAGEARVIPLLLRPVNWQDAPFGKLKALPSNEKPITAWKNRDAAFFDIAQSISVVLDNSQPLPPSSTLSGVWNMPYRRNPHFTGRDELLDQLDQQLSLEIQEHKTSMRRAALTQAIKGLGGIGKTQIAVEYAYRSREQGRYTHILWVNAESEETIISSFVAIVDLLPSLVVGNKMDLRKCVEAVKHWLEQCKQNWLLIFDNADDIALVSNYLPLQGGGSILLTTRADAVGSLATSFEVKTMSFVEGTHLLLRRAQRFDHASEEEINQAGNIVVALDHFPLALDQAGAYIEETKCRFIDYLEIYQKHRSALLARRGEQAVYYPHSVATTWSLSFQKVQQANPAAGELLQLCAFMAPDRIPEELIIDGAASWPPMLQKEVTDLFAFQQMIAELLKFSLVKRLTDDRMLSIHRLVQAVQQDTMSISDQEIWINRVIIALASIFPDSKPATWGQCARILPHALACAALAQSHTYETIELASLLVKMGRYLFDQGRYIEVEPLYLRALSIQERRLKPEHPDLLNVVYQLAILYLEQSKFTQAETFQKRFIHFTKLSGYYANALAINELAILYTARGLYSQAEQLCRLSCSLLEFKQGANHPELASLINNLAGICAEQGKHSVAEPLFQRTLEIRESTLGLEHPDVAQSLFNIATSYHRRGEFDKAEPLYLRARHIQERTLGQEHPTLALTLFELANLYCKQDDFALIRGGNRKNQSKVAQAEQLYLQTLHIQAQALGQEHPTFALSLVKQADFYRNRDKRKAEQLYQRALGILEQALGQEHPDVASTLGNLALLYLTEHKYRQAEQLCQRSLTILKGKLIPNHPAIIKAEKIYVLIKMSARNNQ